MYKNYLTKYLPIINNEYRNTRDNFIEHLNRNTMTLYNGKNIVDMLKTITITAETLIVVYLENSGIYGKLLEDLNTFLGADGSIWKLGKHFLFFNIDDNTVKSAVIFNGKD